MPEPRCGQTTTRRRFSNDQRRGQDKGKCLEPSSTWALSSLSPAWKWNETSWQVQLAINVPRPLMQRGQLLSSPGRSLFLFSILSRTHMGWAFYGNCLWISYAPILQPFRFRFQNYCQFALFNRPPSVMSRSRTLTHVCTSFDLFHTAWHLSAALCDILAFLPVHSSISFSEICKIWQNVRYRCGVFVLIADGLRLMRPIGQGNKVKLLGRVKVSKCLGIWISPANVAGKWKYLMANGR